MKFTEFARSNFEYIAPTSRACNGIYAACSVLLKTGSKVIFPNLMCASPVLTAISAGIQPVLVDVCPSNFCIDPQEVERAILDNPQVGAVFVPHIFGHNADIKKIKDICGKYDVLLFEDCAQSILNSNNGLCSGTEGDVSFFSFGYSKHLSHGTGGAIGAFDRNIFAELSSFIENSMDFLGDEDIKNMRDYRSNYYFIKNNFTGLIARNKYRKLYNKISSAYTKKNPIKFSFEDLNNIDLIEKRDHFLRMVDCYKKNLICDNFFQPKSVGFEVPWRLSMLMSETQRDGMLNHLWRNKMHVSAWYTPISSVFPEYAFGLCPVSKKVSRSIFNLFCDNVVTETVVTEICLSINLFTSENQCHDANIV